MLSSRVKWCCPGCGLPEWGPSLGRCHCGNPTQVLNGECYRCHKGLAKTMVFRYIGRGMCGCCDSSQRMLYTRGPAHSFECCKTCWFHITGEEAKIWS